MRFALTRDAEGFAPGVRAVLLTDDTNPTSNTIYGTVAHRVGGVRVRPCGELMVCADDNG